MLRSARGVVLPWRDHASEARSRLRRSMWPTVQSALAAAIAWVLAHDALGHAQPFFAPIAAAIALGTTGIRRGRRIVQMVFGVTLGIAVGEGASALVGTGPWAIGIVVLATMSAAVVAGVGVFGEGMMFVNQSAASAILVVALHRHGTGSERLVDALVGGGVAGLIGVGLFPAEPLRVLGDAEREVLRSLAGTLEHLAALLSAGTPAQPGWTLAAAQDIHQQLSGLAQARMTARANVRIAPRRWRLRRAVATEDERTARFDLLAGASLSLIRAATDALDTGARLSSRGVEELASVLGSLATGPRPWPDQTLRAARQRIAGVLEHPGDGPLAALVRMVARDVLLVLPSGAAELAGAQA
jgi:uncharacterized membrane protein YgaE (UPF0421/DUF939 family)